MGAGQPRGCATLDRGCKQRPGALGQLRQQPRLSFMPSEFPRMEFGGNSPHCIKTGTLEGNGWQRRLATCTLGGGSPSGPARSALLLLALDAARNEVRILMQVGVLGISHGAIRTWGDRSPRSPGEVFIRLCVTIMSPSATARLISTLNWGNCSTKPSTNWTNASKPSGAWGLCWM